MVDADFQYALFLQTQFEKQCNSPPLNRERRHSTTEEDLRLALTLQQQFEHEAQIDKAHGLVYDTKVKTDTSKSLVDPSWEVIDPTPDIHLLFVAFNERFFWNKLLSVCVSWSKRMTSCAGICSYQGRGGMCRITLSEPLLRLRPRKDLVETLLHEMIHAFLFVTHNNKDRDGHGPEFHKHMYRINMEAGTNITVYHDFHDEVRLYKQHWWRCNGPCQQWKPFFGMVRRATNRAPGPNDRWWAEHSRTCGGEFIKIKEPEKKQKAKEKENKPKISNPKNSINKYFPPLTKSVNSVSGNIHGFNSTGDISKISSKNSSQSVNNNSGTSLKKNSSSTVVIVKKPYHTSSPVKSSTSTSKVSFTTSGQPLGGAPKPDNYSSVRGHWLNKFSNGRKRPPADSEEADHKKLKQSTSQVSCPVCHKMLDSTIVNEHLDECLSESAKEDVEECFACGKMLPSSKLHEHVSECLSESFKDEDLEDTSLTECDQDNKNNKKTDFESENTSCPVCKEEIPKGTLDVHVEKCLHKMYDKIESICDLEPDKIKTHQKKENHSNDDIVIIDDDEIDSSIRHEFESSYSEGGSAKKYNCPFCFRMFLECEMCEHLSQCIKNTVDEEEKYNKSTLLEELNSDSL